MPHIEISVLSGRTPEKISQLMRDLTATVVAWDNIDPSDVSVIVHSVDGARWSSAGEPLTPIT